jgi:hypothetical protein
MSGNKNQSIGAMGEHLVIANLFHHGWSAVNINNTIPNFKGVDIFCQNDNDSVIGIQVKTSASNAGFPLGISNEESFDLNYLEKHCRHPWIFVHILNIDAKDEPLKAEFFILSPSQFISLISTAQDWYVNNYDLRAKPLKQGSIAVMQLKWLRGENTSSNLATKDFINPFYGNSFENAWDNLWKN